jgi:hypothetical protein
LTSNKFCHLPVRSWEFPLCRRFHSTLKVDHLHEYFVYERGRIQLIDCQIARLFDCGWLVSLWKVPVVGMTMEDIVWVKQDWMDDEYCFLVSLKSADC